MKVSYVYFPGEGRQVAISLPVSKCDREGKGVRRTLRCCGKPFCTLWCPWALGKTAVEHPKKQGFVLDAPLFGTRKAGTEITKSGNIKALKTYLGDGVSGHSPMRGGAMLYVRAGLPLQELAFLGRWKSNVVLTYAEEALQEKAVTLPDQGKTLSGTEVFKLKDMLHGFQKGLQMAPATPARSAMQVEQEERTTAPMTSVEVSHKVPRDLWVVTKGRGWKGRPRHLVTKSSWNLAMSAWAAACGWNFAQKSTDFYFVSGSVTDKLKCHKCCAFLECATSQKGKVGRTELVAESNQKMRFSSSYSNAKRQRLMNSPPLEKEFTGGRAGSKAG
eukprot:s2029_g11.t1